MNADEPCHCEEGVLPDACTCAASAGEAISWLDMEIASRSTLAMTCHCEEGVLPDEAISQLDIEIASRSTLAPVPAASVAQAMTS